MRLLSHDYHKAVHSLFNCWRALHRAEISTILCYYTSNPVRVRLVKSSYNYWSIKIALPSHRDPGIHFRTSQFTELSLKTCEKACGQNLKVFTSFSLKHFFFQMQLTYCQSFSFFPFVSRLCKKISSSLKNSF